MNNLRDFAENYPGLEWISRAHVEAVERELQNEADRIINEVESMGYRFDTEEALQKRYKAWLSACGRLKKFLIGLPVA